MCSLVEKLNSKVMLEEVSDGTAEKLEAIIKSFILLKEKPWILKLFKAVMLKHAEAHPKKNQGAIDGSLEEEKEDSIRCYLKFITYILVEIRRSKELLLVSF